MAEYVDGFVIALPKKNIEEYKKVARAMAKVFIDHGAIEVRETIAEDVSFGKVTSFPRSVERKNSETVVFSWVTYKSKAAREKANKALMKDPRLVKVMEQPPTFDAGRMIYGGFETIVKANA
jgi:uncharacterized protein YbaA (DUF1428 family)